MVFLTFLHHTKDNHQISSCSLHRQPQLWISPAYDWLTHALKGEKLKIPQPLTEPTQSTQQVTSPRIKSVMDQTTRLNAPGWSQGSVQETVKAHTSKATRYCPVSGSFSHGSWVLQGSDPKRSDQSTQDDCFLNVFSLSSDLYPTEHLGKDVKTAMWKRQASKLVCSRRKDRNNPPADSLRAALRQEQWLKVLLQDKPHKIFNQK